MPRAVAAHGEEAGRVQVRRARVVAGLPQVPPAQPRARHDRPRRVAPRGRVRVGGNRSRVAAWLLVCTTGVPAAGGSAGVRRRALLRRARRRRRRPLPPRARRRPEHPRVARAPHVSLGRPSRRPVPAAADPRARSRRGRSRRSGDRRRRLPRREQLDDAPRARRDRGLVGVLIVRADDVAAGRSPPSWRAPSSASRRCGSTTSSSRATSTSSTRSRSSLP